MDPRDRMVDIEAIEQAACADMYAAAPASLADTLGLAYCRIDDGLLLICRRLDNLVQSLGRVRGEDARSRGRH